MTTLVNALQIIQVIISVSLVVVIILQARGQGLGSLFGGGDSGMGITKTRRGLELGNALSPQPTTNQNTPPTLFNRISPPSCLLLLLDD